MPSLIAGVEWTGPSVSNFQRRRPVAASRAYRCPSYEPTSTNVSATTGDDLISISVLNVQRRLPARVRTAWMTPLLSPTNTVSPATAGDDSPIALLVAYFQRSFPV